MNNYLVTNLSILQFPNVDQLRSANLLSKANHQLVDSILIHVLHKINARQFTPTIELYKNGQISRREFRASVNTFLFTLKGMLPSSVVIRKSCLEQGFGLGFVQILVSLTTHALRISQQSTDIAQRLSTSTGIQSVLEIYLSQLMRMYSDALCKEKQVQACCTRIDTQYAHVLNGLDEQVYAIYNTIRPRNEAVKCPSSSEIRAMLVCELQRVNNVWAALIHNSARSVRIPRSKDSTGTLDITKDQSDWSNVVSTYVLPALSHCLQSSIHTPYTNIELLRTQFRIASNCKLKADQRCSALEQEIKDMECELQQHIGGEKYTIPNPCPSIPTTILNSNVLAQRITSPTWYATPADQPLMRPPLKRATLSVHDSPKSAAPYFRHQSDCGSTEDYPLNGMDPDTSFDWDVLMMTNPLHSASMIQDECLHYLSDD